MFSNYALIIGVEDYSAYEREAGQPAGTSEVVGAVNDARTFYRQCLAMGFSPERIRVLTSPVLAPADLGPGATPASVGEATHDGIVAGITWLAEALSQPVPAAGLLTFAGHGLSDHGVALCPADLHSSLDNVVHVATLRSQLGQGKAADNLTMLLDCCHAQVGVAPEATIEARLRAQAAGVPVPDLGVAERVIAASARGGTSASSTFGGVKHGAFTWAITAAMGQWKTSEERGVAQLGVSYGELTSRTGKLLAALSFEQETTLSGPQGVEDLAFLHPGVVEHAGETSEAPDAARPHRQLDTGYYVFSVIAQSVESVFANVAVQDDTETWTVYTDAVARLGDVEMIFYQYSPTPILGTGTGPTVTQTTPQECTWSRESSATFPAGGYGFSAQPRASVAVVFTVNPSGQGFKTMTWYNGSADYIGARTTETMFVRASSYEGAGYVTTSTLTTIA